MKARTEGRGTGKTMRMVRALPRHRSLVLVHCNQMKHYVERMIREVRPDLVLNHEVYVRTLDCEHDVDWLRGLQDREIRVDHAVWEHVRPVVCDLLRVQLRLMTRPTHRAGLGVVNATIERDSEGNITAVVLPGTGWS